MEDGGDRDAVRARAQGDLRFFLELARETGELEVIAGADPDLEMGALYELSLEQEDPPVLLFEAMRGCDTRHRIVANVRSALLFQEGQGLERVQSYRRQRKKKHEPVAPRFVNSGPVLENVLRGDAVDVARFPAPKWHAGDGGNYIGTECVIVTKDPDSDWVNLGTYRVQVQDAKTLSVSIEPGKDGDRIRRKYWAMGKPCPMAISVGQAPILGEVAASTYGHHVSEYAIAGGRIGRPIELVQGEVTGLPIPADAELVFEGFMPPPEEEARDEGPFGEWPGYYGSNIRPQPVLRVAAIYHRDDPIVVAQPPAKPTKPGTYYGTAGTALLRAANLWDELEAAGVPGIKGVWKLPGGGPRLINVVAIEQLHAGHAKMAGLVATGCGGAAFFGRITIIVDADIDITKPEEVMWALATRWDPKSQTDIIEGCWSGYIDPLLPPGKRETGDVTNSRLILYAVRPFHWKDEFPKVNAVDPAYAEKVRAKWLDKLAFLGERGGR